MIGSIVLGIFIIVLGVASAVYTLWYEGHAILPERGRRKRP